VRLPFRLGLRGELLLLMAVVLVVVVSLFAALWWHEKRSNQDAREICAAALGELAREGLLARGQSL
jgi:hypothetical protein